MQDSGFQVLLQGNNFLRILQGLGVTIGIFHRLGSSVPFY